MTRNLHAPAGWGASGFIVAIPARNEASRLPATLSSLAADPMVEDVIVIANGCLDATATIARGGCHGLRVAVLDCGTLAGGVGAARRAGIEAALDIAPHAAILATTDADCRVGPDWGGRIVAALARADAVCGRVIPDPDEFARLPAIVRRHGLLEDHVADLAAELEGLRSPAVHDPLPRHGQSPGATLAFRTDAYVAAGGFEAIPCHEDRRIVARIEAAGGRVARPHGLTVLASCRLVGRAPGGMADTIADRARNGAVLRAEIDRFKTLATDLQEAISAIRQVPALKAQSPINHTVVDPAQAGASARNRAVPGRVSRQGP